MVTELEGDWDAVREQLAQEWWPAVKENWVIWGPVQLLNFRFVPGSLQVLYSNVVDLLETTYLRYNDATETRETDKPTAVSSTDSAAGDELESTPIES